MYLYLWHLDPQPVQPPCAVSSASPSGGACRLPFAFVDFAGCFKFPLRFVTGVNERDASGSVSGLVVAPLVLAGTEGRGVVGTKLLEFMVVDPDDSAVDMVGIMHCCIARTRQ